MSPSLLEIINQVRINKGLSEVDAVTSSLRLREDLGFDSLDLAELTARIDEAMGIDIFAQGVLATVGEIEKRLATAGS